MSPVAAEPCVLDPQTLARLGKIPYENNAAFITSLAQAFQKDTRDRIAALELALHSSDAEMGLFFACSISESAETVGGTSLHAACDRVYRLIKESAWNEAQHALAELKARYDECLAALWCYAIEGVAR